MRAEPGRKKMTWNRTRSDGGAIGMRDLVLGRELPCQILSEIFQLSLQEDRLKVAKSLFCPLNNPEEKKK